MVVLGYFESNCLHQCFIQLGNLSPDSCSGPDDDRTVSKSTLAVLCLNIGDSIDVRFHEANLKGHKPDKDSLTFAELLTYVEADLLGETTHLDAPKFRSNIWNIISRDISARQNPLFSSTDVFKVWLVFNRLDDEQRMTLDAGEADAVLVKFAEALGMKRERRKASDDEKRVSFVGVLNQMEVDYAKDVEPIVYGEVLEDLVDEFVLDVVKKGYMTKKGHTRHTWKERWFVLDMMSLTYYISREKMEKKGCVRLTPRSIVEPIPDKSAHKYRLLLTDGVDGRKYELCAVDQRTKQEWMACLKRVIGHQPGSGSLQRVEKMERKREREERRMETQRMQETSEQQRRELEMERQAREEAERQMKQEQQWLQEEMQRRLEAEEQQRKHLEELEREKALKIEEEKEKKNKEELLGEELRRRQELEELHARQQEQLEEEQRKLDEMQQQNEEFMRLLQLEREKYEKAEEERKKAEELYKQALARGESPPKPPKYEVKISPGLARLIGPKGLGLVTHRGMGAFPKDTLPDPQWEERKLSKSLSVESPRSGESMSSSELEDNVDNRRSPSVEVRKAELSSPSPCDLHGESLSSKPELGSHDDDSRPVESPESQNKEQADDKND